MHADPYTHKSESPRLQPPETRLLEVEMENRRLQRLVAELLIKNQQLREQMSLLSGSQRREVA